MTSLSAPELIDATCSCQQIHRELRSISMELRQLRYAEAVARHRHFTRAAEELHVAQSALSQQVRRLESELGAELFQRTSRTVAPTEAGEAVAARARRILAEVDGIRGEIDELRGLVRGRVSIGALLPAGPLDVPRLLARFAKAFPGIEVGLREGTAGDMLRYLADDEVDAAFTLQAGLPDELEGEQLGEEELVAAFPPGSAPERKFVGAHELARYPFVTPRSDSAIARALNELFARADEPMRVSLQSGDPFLLRCLVSTGFGASALPLSLIRREGPPIETRALRPAVRLPVSLIWRRDRHQSPAARAFIDFARGDASK
jgi:LysR family transcriptional regulator, transcription activator of glutamate synthase operon